MAFNSISISPAGPSAVFKNIIGALSITDYATALAATTIATEKNERQK